MTSEQHWAFDVEYPVVGHTVFRDPAGGRSLSVADTYYQPIMDAIVLRLASRPRAEWPRIALVYAGHVPEPEGIVNGGAAIPGLEALQPHLAALMRAGFAFELGPTVCSPGAGPPAQATEVLQALHDFLDPARCTGELTVECV